MFGPNRGRDRIEHPAGNAARTFAEITRVLVQDGREDGSAKHCAGEVIRVRGAEPLGVTLRSLPVTGEIVLPLLDSGIHSGGDEDEGIERAAQRQVELLPWAQGGRVLNKKTC